MKIKLVGMILAAALTLGIIYPGAAAATGYTNVSDCAIPFSGTGTRIYEKYALAEKNLKKQLPEGFPEYIPLIEDASLVNYKKNSENRNLNIILKTSHTAQELWDFYSNVNLYNQFDRCIASFDNKTGKISVEAYQSGKSNKMVVYICQDTDRQMDILISIQASTGNESFLGSIKDSEVNLNAYMEFYEFLFSLQASGIDGLKIVSGRTKPNRDAYRGKIAGAFPPDIPLAKSKYNVGLYETFQIDDVKYTKYKYRLTIPESECMKFYMNYRNYSNLESFSFDYENHSGTKNVKTYARSKAGILAGINYYYNGSNGTVIISHNSAENRLYMP